MHTFPHDASETLRLRRALIIQTADGKVEWKLVSAEKLSTRVITRNHGFETSIPRIGGRVRLIMKETPNPLMSGPATIRSTICEVVTQSATLEFSFGNNPETELLLALAAGKGSIDLTQREVLARARDMAEAESVIRTLENQP
jgi:hypothetical protein